MQADDIKSLIGSEVRADVASLLAGTFAAELRAPAVPPGDRQFAAHVGGIPVFGRVTTS